MMNKLNQDGLLQIDVNPFTRLVWNSTEAREKYEVMLNRALPLHDKAEYEMVRRGLRKCGTIHFSPHTFHSLIERFHKDNMVWLPIQWTRNYGGFSHRHIPTVVGDSNSSAYGVMARNLEDAEAFRRASSYMARGQTDHKKLGDLLLFPDCCSTFFVEKWGDGYYDPVWHSAEETKNSKMVADRVIEVEGHIHTNQMLRYMGLRTTTHFPCSLDCEESIRIGDIWLDVMNSIDQTGTDYLIELLSMPIVWSCLHGVAIVETPIFTIITNSLPTKERWTVLFNVPGGDKPAEKMILLGADVDLPAIAKDTRKHLEAMRGVPHGN